MTTQDLVNKLSLYYQDKRKNEYFYQARQTHNQQIKEIQKQMYNDPIIQLEQTTK